MDFCLERTDLLFNPGSLTFKLRLTACRPLILFTLAHGHVRFRHAIHHHGNVTLIPGTPSHGKELRATAVTNPQGVFQLLYTVINGVVVLTPLRGSDVGRLHRGFKY